MSIPYYGLNLYKGKEYDQCLLMLMIENIIIGKNYNMTYTPKDIHHVPAYIDGIYNPDCLLTEDQAQYMLQLKQKSI